VVSKILQTENRRNVHIEVTIPRKNKPHKTNLYCKPAYCCISDEGNLLREATIKKWRGLKKFSNMKMLYIPLGLKEVTAIQ